MNLTDSRLAQAGNEKLELAMLSFFEQFRKIYIGDQVQKSSKVITSNSFFFFFFKTWIVYSGWSEGADLVCSRFDSPDCKPTCCATCSVSTSDGQKVSALLYFRWKGGRRSNSDCVEKGWCLFSNEKKSVETFWRSLVFMETSTMCSSLVNKTSNCYTCFTVGEIPPLRTWSCCGGNGIEVVSAGRLKRPPFALDCSRGS